MRLVGNCCAMNAEPEGESVEQPIVKLGVMAELSERDRIAIAFAIRCAYALGRLDAESERRVA